MRFTILLNTTPHNATLHHATMTVKEIFELRREGKVEEAYNAILPMY